jgi:hypothetical protein
VMLTFSVSRMVGLYVTIFWQYFPLLHLFEARLANEIEMVFTPIRKRVKLSFLYIIETQFGKHDGNLHTVNNFCMLQDDLEQFGDVGSLDDNVESFLSNDDGDARDIFATLKRSPVEPNPAASKGNICNFLDYFANIK